MEDNLKLYVAINLLDSKIAKYTLEASKNLSPELDKKLKKYLDMKKEIYEGNKSLIDEIINDIDNKDDWFKRKD